MNNAKLEIIVTLCLADAECSKNPKKTHIFLEQSIKKFHPARRKGGQEDLRIQAMRHTFTSLNLVGGASVFASLSLPQKTKKAAHEGGFDVLYQKNSINGGRDLQF